VVGGSIVARLDVTQSSGHFSCPLNCVYPAKRRSFAASEACFAVKCINAWQGYKNLKLLGFLLFYWLLTGNFDEL
jgi:hypothetical protein